MKKLIAALFGFMLVGVLSAQRAPNELWGSVYNAVFPTYTSPQTAIWQSTVNGRLNVTGLGAPVSQFLLLTSGFILQTNGVAKICLAGTC